MQASQASQASQPSRLSCAESLVRESCVRLLCSLPDHPGLQPHRLSCTRQCVHCSVLQCAVVCCRVLRSFEVSVLHQTHLRGCAGRLHASAHKTARIRTPDYTHPHTTLHASAHQTAYIRTQSDAGRLKHLHTITLPAPLKRVCFYICVCVCVCTHNHAPCPS